MGPVSGLVRYPKIELHVHLEGTVGPETLLTIARRNGLPLPAATGEELAQHYRYRDFEHFIQVWIMTTNVMRTEEDFRQVVVDYAAQAATYSAVYLEGSFSPGDRVQRGVAWDTIFAGYCDGIQQAREQHGVEVRLTPEITRNDPLELAEEIVRYAVKYRERGVVGVGLGGREQGYPPELFAPVFQRARNAGLGSVPHAGEAAGPASVRGALDALRADRVRHGIRAIDDPVLVRELAERGVVLDVCLTSNLRTGVVRSLREHPLPVLLGAGVRCSLSTDDPAMFGTDLGREYAAAISLGVSPRDLYEAGVAGALCDDGTRDRLRAIGAAFDWATGGEGQPPPMVAEGPVFPVGKGVP